MGVPGMRRSGCGSLKIDRLVTSDGPAILDRTTCLQAFLVVAAPLPALAAIDDESYRVGSLEGPYRGYICPLVGLACW